MNDEELDRKLRLLDVVNGKPDRSVDHPAAKTALFEEITMQHTTTSQLERNDADQQAPHEPTVISWEPARSKRRRAFTMLASAAAGVGLVGAGLIIVESGGAQTAEAMILEAAAESAEFSSGRITTTIEVDELGDDPESSGLVGIIDYRFDGDDFRTQMTTEVADTSLMFGQLRVDGVLYTSTTENEWVEGGDESGALLGLEAFGMSREPTTPDSIVELVEAADDLAVASSDEDTTTFTGTIPATELVEIGENLPPGLRLLAAGDDPTDELPTEIMLSVAVTDDLLREVVVDMDGTSPIGEVIDATVTIDYTGYGEPQEIAAPGPSQIVDASLPNFDSELGEEYQTQLDDALAVLAEVDERRPGLCDDAATAQGANPTPEGIAEMTAELEACYLAAGETEAAAAITFLTGPIGSND